MDVTDIEKALNELIAKATESGGFVWIVDKKGNNFYVRLTDAVTIKAFIKEKENNDNNKHTN